MVNYFSNTSILAFLWKSNIGVKGGDTGESDLWQDPG